MREGIAAAGFTGCSFANKRPTTTSFITKRCSRRRAGCLVVLRVSLLICLPHFPNPLYFGLLISVGALGINICSYSPP